MLEASRTRSDGTWLETKAAWSEVGKHQVAWRLRRPGSWDGMDMLSSRT